MKSKHEYTGLLIPSLNNEQCKVLFQGWKTLQKELTTLATVTKGDVCTSTLVL